MTARVDSPPRVSSIPGVNASRQRKLAVGLLGLALAALVVDRTVLSPAGAEAAPPAAAAPASTPAAAPAAPATTENSTPGNPRKPAQPSVNERLDRALSTPKWSTEELLGSLRPSPKWAADPGSTGDTGDPSLAFDKKHQLKAVMGSRDKDENRVALVGGQPLRVGDTLDGMRLVSVGARSAVFEAGSVRVVLSLPEPEKPAARTEASQGR